MRFARYTPPVPLAHFVEFFWFYEDLNQPHHFERVLPDGTFQLIINLREEPRHTFSPDDLSPDRKFRGAWLAGMHTEPVTIDTAADASMIGAQFLCGGANVLLGRPASEVSGQIVTLQDLWGAEGARLRERLLEARGAARKFAVLERFLIRKAAGALEKPAPVNHAIKLLQEAPESRTIRSLAAEIGWSQKHFIETFRNSVGTSPKRFARVRRFQKGVKALQRSSEQSWSDLALECGYYDQAHFNMEFKEFSGFTPGDFVRAAGGRLNFIPISPG